jgi:anaerobic magnesium-protoporphyrin IX monomethyl ester cyclase
MDVSFAVSQIQTLKNQYQVSNFYMSVDVLRPAFAVDSARMLIDRNVNIKWSTDLRIEKSYTGEQTDLLYKSGLVSVAFGVESACEGVLKKMNKGINRELITTVNRLFWKSGIAPCWMMFHYHPGETVADAMESVQFLDEHRHEVALFIIGEFGLTPHSKIFNQHVKFGIREITYHPDDDFRLYPVPEVQSILPSSSIRHAEKLDRAVSKTASHYKLSPYPFAGAISTHHSMLYFIRFGQNAFQR